ncbi:MAG: hypothetical protein ACLQIK_00255 [Mycobacterium sp.]
MSDLWTTIAAERGALAGDLAALTPAQLRRPHRRRRADAAGQMRRRTLGT